MAIHYNPKIVTDGLVLYLDSVNTKSYPGSGNIWYDLSGRGNDATATPVSSTSDTPGTVISLDASGLITCNLAVQVDKYSFTLSYWGRPVATPDSNYQPIFSVIDSVNPHGYYFIGDTREVAAPYVLHYVKDFTVSDWDTRQMVNTAVYSTYVWNYYTLVVYAENDWRSYLDGVHLGNNTTPSQDLSGYGNVTSVTLGGTSCNFNICSVALYDRELTQVEIEQNFNASRGRFGL